MAVGKTTLLLKFNDTSVQRCFDEDGTDPMLTSWYHGKFSTYFWEGYCVRKYLAKETSALRDLLMKPAISSLVFDRSSIDCFCFVIALYFCKFFDTNRIDGDFMPCIQLVLNTIIHSMKYMSTVNAGKMIYIEMANRHSYKNLKKRNRPAEQYYFENDDDEWNPSWIFSDSAIYDKFNDLYGYASLILANILSCNMDEVIFITNRSNDSVEDQKFNTYKASENPQMNLWRNELKINPYTSFILDKNLSPIENISAFLILMTDENTIASLYPFATHPIFKNGKPCNEKLFLFS